MRHILGASNMTILDVYVNVLYATHENMKSHTGGCVIFNRGAIMGKSIEQKFNTKSSTEAELVGTSNYIPTDIYIQDYS